MPTHLIEGGDYGSGSGALAGERIHKDAAPATEFRQYQANALWHGLRTLVKQEQISGDLTAASGSADQTEGYVRLAKAIRRAARRATSENIIDVEMGSAGYTLVPSVDGFVYNLTEDTPHGINSLVNIDTDVDFIGRTILIFNLSTQPKLIGDFLSGERARLSPGEACLFHAAGTGLAKWTPIGKEFYVANTGSFAISLRGSTSGELAIGTMRWAIRDGRAFLDIDAMSSVSLSGTESVTITAAAGAALPSFLDALSAGEPRIFLIPILHAGASAIGMLSFFGAAGSRKIDVLNSTGVSSFATSIRILGTGISYQLA